MRPVKYDQCEWFTMLVRSDKPMHTVPQRVCELHSLIVALRLMLLSISKPAPSLTFFNGRCRLCSQPGPVNNNG